MSSRSYAQLLECVEPMKSPRKLTSRSMEPIHVIENRDAILNDLRCPHRKHSRWPAAWITGSTLIPGKVTLQEVESPQPRKLDGDIRWPVDGELLRLLVAHLPTVHEDVARVSVWLACACGDEF